MILIQFLNNFEQISNMFSKDPEMRKLASSNKTVFHILHNFFLNRLSKVNNFKIPTEVAQK